MPNPWLEVATVVYYPPHGVGVVSEIKDETILGETFWVIRVFFKVDRVTVTLRKNQIHKLLKPEEFAHETAIAKIPSILRGRSLRNRKRTWKTEFDAVGKRIRGDSFEDLIQGIRDLAQREKLPLGSHPSTQEIILLREAMRRLRDLLILVAPAKTDRILAEADVIFKEQGFLPLSNF
jgi:RNA polymerase-interacting CarD/CdnL/TRCF family regulator